MMVPTSPEIEAQRRAYWWTLWVLIYGPLIVAIVALC